MNSKKATLLFVLLAAGHSILSQNPDPIAEIKKFQDELNQEYKAPGQSPLDPKGRKKFKGHEFFSADLKFRVTARLDRTVDDEIFQMKTSTTRLANYKKYAIAVFSIDGKEYRLTLYQSTDLMKKSGYEDYLFIPFTDKTTGEQTYGAGRYMDTRIPPGDEIIIDFNKAYNPYCAYSNRYSCPRVPDENQLDIEITAGIKYTEKH